MNKWQEHVKTWRENKDMIDELGLDLHEFPKSHMEIYKNGILQNVLYSPESLNFYLKSLKGKGWEWKWVMN